MGLSVILITQNEEKDIRGALESVYGWVDEIVVVDSGSKDATLEICKEFTSNIFQKDWSGYGPQKQFALNKATGSWILNIDADERVSPPLREEITQILKTDLSGVNGFKIPFHHYFLGQRLKFGGSWGEKHIRLFRKEKSSYEPDPIHEGIQVQPRVGLLKNHIDHFSYRTIEDYLDKCNHYTSLISKKKFILGERFHLWHYFRLPYEFFVRYVLKLGFIDGGMGLLYSILSSYYVWLKYVKLKDLEN